MYCVFMVNDSDQLPLFKGRKAYGRDNPHCSSPYGLVNYFCESILQDSIIK